VLEKIGTRLEGRLRQNEYFKDRWWDTLLFAMLDSEWWAQQPPASIDQ
jgi:RimJ/RimL family protein N-acetyltransferase